MGQVSMIWVARVKNCLILTENGFITRTCITIADNITMINSRQKPKQNVKKTVTQILKEACQEYRNSIHWYSIGHKYRHGDIAKKIINYLDSQDQNNKYLEFASICLFFALEDALTKLASPLFLEKLRKRNIGITSNDLKNNWTINETVAGLYDQLFFSKKTAK